MSNILLLRIDKQHILEDADYLCAKCGKLGKPSTNEHRYLHIHHRDKNPHNNEANNLEVLCTRCHIKHHFAVDLGLSCENCKSSQIVKIGFRRLRDHRLQRYQCQRCGHVFTHLKKGG